MATWLFQGNPDLFDVDGYLTADSETVSWLVRQYGDQVAIGDTVFIWKSIGATKAISGVVAECRIASLPEVCLPDAASAPYWKDDSMWKPEPRVELLVIRVARAKEVLKREWLKADPILRSLPIFKMAQATNFLVAEPLASRLRSIWDRTGRDWTWRDSVAGLWAYAETLGGSVSELPGSPVANVAVAIGRAVGGVYNKVMNFRAIDPTDLRAGMSGGGETDREVWQSFFDPVAGRIDRDRLAAEVRRLDLDLSGHSAEVAPAPLVRTSATGGLNSLLKRYKKGLAAGVFNTQPPLTRAATQTFVRNPLVVAIARLRAANRCEVPGCSVATFIAENDAAYCEVHHITPLAEGGLDTIENAICLCPVHHREAHYGKQRKALIEVMRSLRTMVSI